MMREIFSPRKCNEIQDEFRDRKLVTIMADNIRRMAQQLKRPVNFMEVCGTTPCPSHQYGLRSLLPDEVHLVSGPGCPVCVTPVGYVDNALACTVDKGNIVATFGDMLRVPGSSSSLMEQRSTRCGCAYRLFTPGRCCPCQR